jgi:hypothetical protein
MIIVDVWVPGAAKTKGSMVARPNGSMKESVIGSSQWRALMAQAVRDDIARRCLGRTGPYPGAVSVTVVAYLAMPSTVSRSLFARPGIFPIWERAGDLDKLVRNVLDALGSKSKNSKMNGGAIVDDNLVCRLDAWKHVAGDGPGQFRAGVRIKVETL